MAHPEFLILTCWSCSATFYTASERSTHHLDVHERLTRWDGTPLVPLLEVPMFLTENGMPSREQMMGKKEGGATLPNT